MASIYIHVPFCQSRCRYCAFYSGEPLDQLDRYLDAVVVEARLRADEGFIRGPIESVFFGGGTPTLLGTTRLGRLLTHCDDLWGLATDPEVTVECNPGSFTDFAGLRAAGVTRCSLGVQSLADPTLARLGRGHTAAQARQAVSRAASAGFASVSADLLYGLARVDPDRTAREVTELASRGADHLSAYSLEIHPGTPLAHEPGSAAPPDLEERQWQALLEGAHTSGFAPYEVSNFALPGAQCRHNRAYWEGSPYLGLGPGAHGYRPREGPWGTRRWNAPDLDAYAAALGRGHMPPGERDPLGRREATLEVLFLWLRRPVPLARALLPARRFSWLEKALAPHLEALVRGGDLRGPDFTPTPRGMRRADGLALWLFRKISPLGSNPS